MKAKHQPTPEQIKQIKEAFEIGLKIVIKQPDKPRTEAPLFGEFNSVQSKLF